MLFGNIVDNILYKISVMHEIGEEWMKLMNIG